MLIILSGLPGAGKTTLGRALARRQGAVFLRVDAIEAGLAQSTLGIARAEDAGYRVACNLAEEHLKLGQTVIVDSVNPVEATRAAYRAVARRTTRPFAEVEVVCSDPGEHQARVEGRAADLPGQNVPSWQDVLARHYETWDVPPLRIDTAGRSVEACLKRLLAHLPPPTD